MSPGRDAPAMKGGLASSAGDTRAATSRAKSDVITQNVNGYCIGIVIRVSGSAAASAIREEPSASACCAAETATRGSFSDNLHAYLAGCPQGRK